MSSKAAPAPSLVQVPNLFSIVEPGVYRCASPTASQIPFLSSLNLKTIVSLTPEHPIRPLLTFTRSTGVDFIHLGLQLWRPYGTDWKPVRDEIVKTTLERYILDTRAHPVLLIDPIGVHQTGCVVGALRMMQGWNFASVLVEYRAHAGSKHRYADEQYIELFDPEYINLPSDQYRPSWWFYPGLGGSDGDYDPDSDSVSGVGGDGGADEVARASMREVDGVVPGQEEVRDPTYIGVDGDESRLKTIGNKLEGG